MWYKIGLWTGIVAGIAIVAISSIISKKKGGKGILSQRGEYDERQVAARGKCFKTAFFFSLLTQLALLLLAQFTEITYFTDPMMIMLSLFLDCTVFIIMAIWHDAYFTPVEKPGQFILAFAALGLLNFTGFMRHLSDGSLLDEAGHLDTGIMNLGVAVLMLASVAAALLKQVHDKKAASRMTEDDAE